MKNNNDDNDLLHKISTQWFSNIKEKDGSKPPVRISVNEYNQVHYLLNTNFPSVYRIPAGNAVIFYDVFLE